MGSEGPVLEAAASASFQGGVCRAGPGESMWLNVPPCEPTSSPRGAHGRPQGLFTLNFRSREGAKASSQYRAAPRSPQARAAQRARPRRSALSVAKSGAAPGGPMAHHGPRHPPTPRRPPPDLPRSGMRGDTGARHYAGRLAAHARTAGHRVPSCPFAARPRLCATAGPRPACRLQGHEPRQRKRVDSETSARLPPRTPTPGLSRRPHRVNASGARNGQSPRGRDPPL